MRSSPNGSDVAPDEGLESLPTYERDEVFFPYPPARSFFSDLSAFAPAVVVLAFYLPYLSRFPIGELIGYGVVIAGMFLVFPVLWRLFHRADGIVISEQGISCGRRSIRWGEIRRKRLST